MDEGNGPKKATQPVATAWTNDIPDEEWAVYQRVIKAAKEAGLLFALGGAFAIATYTGNWRNTKDLDLFILPESRELALNVLDKVGMQDLFEREEYDRAWIYRSVDGDTIVDVIWSMANQRAPVDQSWLDRGAEIDLRGERVQVIAVEELIWAKLYIIHKDRTDWTDVLNLIYAMGPTLDWERLLWRLEDDALLLSGVLCVFAWLCPGRVAQLPAWLWDRLQLPALQSLNGPELDQCRVDWLDTRPWFAGSV